MKQSKNMKQSSLSICVCHCRLMKQYKRNPKFLVYFNVTVTRIVWLLVVLATSGSGECKSKVSFECGTVAESVRYSGRVSLHRPPRAHSNTRKQFSRQSSRVPEPPAIGAAVLVSKSSGVGRDPGEGAPQNCHATAM